MLKVSGLVMGIIAIVIGILILAVPPAEMGPGNWLYRGWFTSHPEKATLHI